MISDIFSIVFITGIGRFIINPTRDPMIYTGFWLMVAIVTVALAVSYGGYGLQGGPNPGLGIEIVILCFLVTGCTMIGLADLMRRADLLGGPWIFAYLFCIPVILVATRRFLVPQSQRLLVSLSRGGPILICKNDCPQDIAQSLRAAGITADISGVFFLNGCQQERDVVRYPVIRNSEDLLAKVKSLRFLDIVFLEQFESDPALDDQVDGLVAELLALPAQIWLAVKIEPRFSMAVNYKNGRYKIVPIVSNDMIYSTNPGKRAFDLILGSLLLCLLSPVLVLIAILVKISDPGPAIFRQTRIGAQGNTFTVLKFRTMKVRTENDFRQAAPCDPRVTRIGGFLRRTSLDELLQLINVIKGDMSLVGPRPHAPETLIQGIQFEKAIRFYRVRYRVKPGITGLAQIRGQRGETRITEKLQQRISSDLEYIAKWSFWLDIIILLRTIPVFFIQTNAY